MLFVLDIGNSNITAAVHDGSSWMWEYRIETDARRLAGWYCTIISRELAVAGISTDGIDSAAISSVVPGLTSVFIQVAKDLFSIQALVITKHLITGIDPDSIPEELGSDLLANAAQAHFIHPERACMVVDFGTALTFTTLSAEGRILGVAITPGIGTSLCSLRSQTAQLPQIDMAEPESVLGCTTEASIKAGLFYGYAGMVGKIIEQTELELGLPLTVIVTGGYAPMISPSIARVDELYGQHTLDGIRLIHSLNC